jgi:DNA-binding beta-propeller fold protein YncE
MSVFDLSPDGEVIVTSGGGIQLWNIDTGELIKTIDPGFGEGTPNSVTFTPDGKRLFTSNQDWTIKVWDVTTGKLIKTLFVQSNMASEAGNNIVGLAYSPDGNHFCTVTSNGKVALWDAEAVKQIRPLAGRENLSRLMFSPDGSEIVGATYYSRKLMYWDALTGDEVKHERVPDWVRINAGGFAIGQFGAMDVRADTEGGKIILSDANSRTVLASLISQGGNRWVLATPEGRFDTNGDLGKIDGISWVLSDDPMTPRPLDLFMRQYFEPELLRRILIGEQFKPLPPIGQINRVQSLVGKPKL